MRLLQCLRHLPQLRPQPRSLLGPLLRLRPCRLRFRLHRHQLHLRLHPCRLRRCPHRHQFLLRLVPTLKHRAHLRLQPHTTRLQPHQPRLQPVALGVHCRQLIMRPAPLLRFQPCRPAPPRQLLLQLRALGCELRAPPLRRTALLLGLAQLAQHLLHTRGRVLHRLL